MAGSKYMRTVKKLQTACKIKFGIKLLLDQRQWYHKDKDMAVTVYTLYQAVSNEANSSKIKLFQTYSQIQLVLFMRDLWYELNGWEVPNDNKVWEDIKQNYEKRKEPSEQTPTTSGEQQRSECPTERNRATVCDELYPAWKRNRGGKNYTKSAKTK